VESETSGHWLLFVVVPVVYMHDNLVEVSFLYLLGLAFSWLFSLAHSSLSFISLAVIKGDFHVAPDVSFFNDWVASFDLSDHNLRSLSPFIFACIWRVGVEFTSHRSFYADRLGLLSNRSCFIITGISLAILRARKLRFSSGLRTNLRSHITSVVTASISTDGSLGCDNSS